MMNPLHWKLSNLPEVAELPLDSEGLTLGLVLVSRTRPRVFHIYDFVCAVPSCRVCVTNFLNPQLTQSARLSWYVSSSKEFFWFPSTGSCLGVSKRFSCPSVTHILLLIHLTNS